MRKLGLAVATLGLLLLLATTTSSSQTNLETVRVMASLIDGATPVLYADNAGLFRKAGLNVVLQRATSGSATAAATIGGSVDIGEGNVFPIIAAHARGVPLVFVAPASIYDPRTPDAALLVTPESAIHSPSDLVGKTVGTTALADLNTLATTAWMDRAHVDWRSVQYVEISLPTLTAALDQGRVQAIVHLKPFMTDAVDSGKARVVALVYSSISNRFLESAWFATSGYVAAHKETVAKFARVVAQASAYTNAHHAETVDLLASWTGIDAQRVARVPRAVTGTIMQARDLQPVIDSAAKYNLIVKGFNANDIIAQF